MNPRAATTRPENPLRKRLTNRVLAVLTGLLVLGACGKGGGDTAAATIDSSTPGARNFLGHFANVPTAPAGAAQVTGLAEMTVADGRTRVDVLVAGLDGKSTYIAHVHNDVCSAADPGGGHFKFKADGADTPPNEIHLPIALAVDPTGVPTKTGTKGGSGDVTVDGEAGPAAKSVVIHLLRKPDATADESKPPKVACADLILDDGSTAAPAPTETPTTAPSPHPSTKPSRTPKPAKTAKPKMSATPLPTAGPTAEPTDGASPAPTP
jgi:hypothetical protein